jgi:hypothetical protein
MVSSKRTLCLEIWARLLHVACSSLLTDYPFFIRFAAQSQASIVRMPLIGGTESKREGPWPECVGLTGAACKILIEATGSSDLMGNIQIIPEDYMVTMDFRTDRVRIFVDGDGLVARIPHRG